MEEKFDICCGVDVGKWSHHFAAVDTRTGEVVMEGGVGQDEREIRRALAGLAGMGRTVVVVDQPGGMSALLFAVADEMGLAKGFITPTAMSRAAEMLGGDAKTDARDARVIAEVSAGLPRLVKPVGERGGAFLELASLMSYDRELTAESTRAANRLHDLLASTCPALEAHLAGAGVQGRLHLAVLERYGGRLGLEAAGREEVARWAAARRGVGPAALARLDALFDAIAAQSVSVRGAEFAERLVRLEASRLLAALDARREVAARRDAVLAGIPEAAILMSLPGLGGVTCATFLAEVGDASSFGSAAQLAAYAGLAPRVRQSGTSVRSVTRPHGGNRRLKRVLVLSAAKSIPFCEESRAYYERKRAEGRGYREAVVALARMRLNVIFAMLRDGRPYEKR